MGIFSLSIHIHVHTCYASISVLISAYANNILGYFIGQLYIAFSLFEHGTVRYTVYMEIYMDL